MRQTHHFVSINIRAKDCERDLIDQAAAQLGRSRSDFMLEAACHKAEKVLLEQAFFTVSPDLFRNLQGLMDMPHPETEKLKKLFGTKAPWDR